MALYAHLWNYRAESTDCEIYAAALLIEFFSTNLNSFFIVLKLQSEENLCTKGESDSLYLTQISKKLHNLSEICN